MVGPDAATGLDTRLADWERRLDRLEAALAPSALNGSHVLFVPSPSGYALLERSGASPMLGASLELDGYGHRYAVVRVGRSPLPDDLRSCAYLVVT